MDESQIMMMLRGGAEMNQQVPAPAQQQQAPMSMMQPAAQTQPDYMIAGLPTPGDTPSWMQSPQEAQKPAQPQTLPQPAQAKPMAKPATQMVNKLPPQQIGKHINEMQSYLSQWGAQLPPEQKAKLTNDLDMFIYQQLTPQERGFFPGLSPQQRQPTWKPLGGAK